MKKLTTLFLTPAAIFVISATFPIATHAGGREAGNGGEGIYCPQKNQVELFDYYEAEEMRAEKIALGADSLDYHQKIQMVMDRLKAVDPIRAAFYSDRINSFSTEARFVSGVALTPIQDAQALLLPKDCKLIQLAVQRPPQFPGDFYYYIDQDYWNLMDNTQKAGLILHEIIYREAIASGAENSSGARFLNSTLANADWVTPDALQFGKIVNQAHLSYFDFYIDRVAGLVWKPFSLGRLEDGTPVTRTAEQLIQACNDFKLHLRPATLSELEASSSALWQQLVDQRYTHPDQPVSIETLDTDGNPVYESLGPTGMTESSDDEDTHETFCVMPLDSTQR